MTLTVRLKPDLESALELHCAERGVSKSLVVQEVLAEYLARPPRRRQPTTTAAEQPAQPSANYLAFQRLGLIGCVSGVGPADKAGVRAAMQRRFEQRRTASEAAQAQPVPKAQPASKRRATR